MSFICKLDKQYGFTRITKLPCKTSKQCSISLRALSFWEAKCCHTLYWSLWIVWQKCIIEDKYCLVISSSQSRCPIHYEIGVWKISLQNVCYQQRSIEDIHIIVATRKDEEGMSYSKLLVSNHYIDLSYFYFGISPSAMIWDNLFKCNACSQKI